MLFEGCGETTKAKTAQQFVFYSHFNGDLSKDNWERRVAKGYIICC
jgi:hypothetical protein